MKYAYTSIIALAAAAASLAGCSTDISSPQPTETAGHTEQAATGSSISASLTVTNSNTQMINLTGTVTNNSSNPASNWQVAVNLGGNTLAQGTSGAEVNMISGRPVFSPNANAGILGAGQSVTWTFTVNKVSGGTTPTVSSIDGVAGSTVVVGGANDGVDHIARGVATGALNVAIAYENNKLPNTGDPNYGQYDGFIWSAQALTISGGKVVFDSNMPGYAFIPNQAQAALEAMQDNPSVQSYLVAGLTSCFNDTKSDYIYDFRAQVLKGYQNHTTTSGTMIGTRPAANAYTPPGYSANNVIDNWSTVGLASAGSVINVTETSTVNPSSAQDYWFGLLTFETLSSFGSPAAIVNKFGSSGQTAACTPFNGPGGTANPYFTVSLNNQVVPARFTGNGAQCQSQCKSTMNLDPDAYAIPGPYYNSMGLVGPVANPFGFDLSQTTATPDHVSQYATSTNASGGTVYGEFIAPVSHKGTTTGYNWVQCGIGAGC